MFILGIAGGSGSGKTTFATHLEQKIKDSFQIAKKTIRISTLHLDNYYLKNCEHLKNSKGQINYDHPSAFNWEKFHFDIQKLKNNEIIEYQSYDFKTHRLLPEIFTVEPCDLLIIEGLYLFYDEKLRDLFNLKIFMDVDQDLCLLRKVVRDYNDRHRTIEQITEQYLDFVKPMFEQYLLPTRHYAHFLVPSDSKPLLEATCAYLQNLLLS